MTCEEFIKEVAKYVQKYAPKYGLLCNSAIIAQACLESSYGTSNKAKYHNYFGLKYRTNRVSCNNGYFNDGGSEQNKDGSYTLLPSTTAWYAFDSMERGIEGYCQFVDIANYKSIKGITDPYTYLKNIKSCGYATSQKYVDNVYAVVKKWNLTQYDVPTITKDDNKKENNDGGNKMSYVVKTNYAHKSNYGSYRNVSAIKYIVWHYTANDGDTDESNAKYFKTANRNASAHYFVDDDSVTISVPDTYVAWSVGGSRYSNYKTTGGASLYKVCTNTNSISIELCDTNKNGKYDVSERTLENAIILTRQLMDKYDIPISNVVRHFDVTGKSCPAYYVDNDKWNKVKMKITKDSVTSTNSNVSNTSSEKTPTTSTKDTSFKVKVIVSALNIRSGAGTSYKKVGCIKDKGTYTIAKTSGNWGYLKSGAGWINISSAYVKRI